MTRICDIETISASPETILAIRGEFSRDSLKPPGNISKSETIEKWCLEQERTWMTPPEAGLKPIWSQIAIAGFAGMGVDGKVEVVQHSLNEAMDEKGVINDAWFAISRADLIVGYNIDFDLSMLIARSVICGVAVPRGIRKGRFLSSKFACIMQAIHGSEYVSLETTLRACGMPSKTASGADFAELWQKDKKAALEYNCMDTILEYQLAKRVGLL